MGRRRKELTPLLDADFLTELREGCYSAVTLACGHVYVNTADGELQACDELHSGIMKFCVALTHPIWFKQRDKVSGTTYEVSASRSGAYIRALLPVAAEA